MAQEVTDATFEAEVLKSKIPVVIDFWAPWCGPCKVVGPVIDELATEYEGKVKFLKMNVDENGGVPGQFSIMSIPTFIIFVNGEPKKTFIGARPKDDIKREIESAIAA